MGEEGDVTVTQTETVVPERTLEDIGNELVTRLDSITEEQTRINARLDSIEGGYSKHDHSHDGYSEREHSHEGYAGHEHTHETPRPETPPKSTHWYYRKLWGE